MSEKGQGNRSVVRIAFRLAAVLALGMILIVGMGVYRARKFAANFQALRMGDSKEQVLDLLGGPNGKFAKGSQLVDAIRKQNLILRLLTPESPETWVYGRWRFVWLGPSEGDYVVEFDEAGTVSGFYRNPRHLQAAHEQ